MTDPQDQPAPETAATPDPVAPAEAPEPTSTPTPLEAAKKAPAKKAPAKKAPAKKAAAQGPAKKAPAKKAPAKKAPAAAPAVAGAASPLSNGAKEAAAQAKSTVEAARNPLPAPTPPSGRSPVALVGAGIAALFGLLLLRRLLRR